MSCRAVSPHSADGGPVVLLVTGVAGGTLCWAVSMAMAPFAFATRSLGRVSLK